MRFPDAVCQLNPNKPLSPLIAYNVTQWMIAPNRWFLSESVLRKALNSLRNHWVALGRKNWMFAGSLAGGERSAGFMTLD